MEGFFRVNGSFLLEELIASSNGNCNPLRTFSSDQILEATNNFAKNRIVAEDVVVWYRGMMDERLVLIKKRGRGRLFRDNIIRDTAVSSLMSSHKNVLKLLGCCLEFRYPALVFEYAEKGALTVEARVGQDATPLPWNIRLKIAKQIASAVTYLHTTSPRIIIHRNINPTSIFLDKNWTAKLSSFELSISIPEGESFVHDSVCGVTGFLDPVYRETGFVTENVDIYSFGMTMLVLVTGQYGMTEVSNGDYVILPEYVGQLMVNGQIAELIDPTMLNGGELELPKHQRLQMEAFVKLALRCVRFRPGEDVLQMIDVAKELKRIEKSTDVT